MNQNGKLFDQINRLNAMKKYTLKKADLKQFIGTDNWYRHGIVRHVLYTDGVRYVAEHAGAHWLIDQIATNQLDPKIASEEFQFWKLSVKKDRSAILTCDNGEGQIIFTQKIRSTDFPLDEIHLNLANNTILLPSEY